MARHPRDSGLHRCMSVAATSSRAPRCTSPYLNAVSSFSPPMQSVFSRLVDLQRQVPPLLGGGPEVDPSYSYIGTVYLLTSTVFLPPRLPLSLVFCMVGSANMATMRAEAWLARRACWRDPGSAGREDHPGLVEHDRRRARDRVVPLGLRRRCSLPCAAVAMARVGAGLALGASLLLSRIHDADTAGVRAEERAYDADADADDADGGEVGTPSMKEVAVPGRPGCTRRRLSQDGRE
ncbi:hypothetical protein PHLGIDRAFT_120352 [Phlebiopsis gigantea 11061_1 CR5-6]|uniref:Uncharacterized protein n=1 Tax=Phlebiopsis gigantea (strain 11061_1 CR5-6) TaxID=745531 RepID=A0A0C3NJ03_PHLG1|nr:hypothetical protein PHLGIDRAFT_120352 [Phlebiopsis gigantea 11061_1 CR5-6]